MRSEYIKKLKRVFDYLDKKVKLRVPRAMLIFMLREDHIIARLMRIGAVCLPKLEKILTLARILYKIEMEEFVGSEEE